MTCAHNIYDRTYEEEITELKFSPGENQDKGKSFNVKNRYYPEEYRTTHDKSESTKFDFGILELENDLEEEYGYLGIDMSEDNAEDVESMKICGYPGDKKP